MFGCALYTCHVLREGKVKEYRRSQHGRGREGVVGETELWGGRGWSEDTDQMRGGKGKDGSGRGQSWGSLRRDEEGRVWWEGEGMGYGVVGKVEGRGEWRSVKTVLINPTVLHSFCL